MIALIGEAALIRTGVRARSHSDVLGAELLGLIPYLVAMWAVARSGLRARPAAVLVVGVGLVLQCLAISAPPRTSDDVYRYIFDAKVQLAGIDPYRYPPDSPALERVRSKPLFGGEGECGWFLRDGTCSEVNRPQVRTIYPPVAQSAFLAARLADGERSDGPRPLQVLALLCALGVSLLLARGSGKGAGLPAWCIGCWAWCPITAYELGNNAHIDGLAVLLSISSLSLAAARRLGWAGVLIGAAVLTKLYPGLLILVLLRRRGFRVLLGAFAVAVVGYLPHVLVVGTDVIGYLPGYLKEEDYTTGGRFRLLSLVIPDQLLTPSAVVALGCLCLFAIVRSEPLRPERAAVWLVGAGLLITTPAQTWYVLLLLALIAATGQLQWLPVCVAPTLAELAGLHFTDAARCTTVSYVLALVSVTGWFVATKYRPHLRSAALRFSAKSQAAAGRGD